MNKHTPGPWKATENEETGNTTTITAISGSCELHIAEVTGSMQIINARLIAYAPELLAALEYIDQQIDLAMAAPSLYEVDGYLNRIRMAARAAIAKAKGE